MQKRKQHDPVFTKQDADEKVLSCHECGREKKGDNCTWQEDDDAMICPDCLAERDSCSCSD